MDLPDYRRNRIGHRHLLDLVLDTAEEIDAVYLTYDTILFFLRPTCERSCERKEKGNLLSSS